MVERRGGEREHREARLVDEEGVLVGAVGGAAVLHDAEAPGGHLFGHAVVEEDDAVGDVLLEALPREGAVAALGGDDRGDPAVLQPAEEAAELGAEDGLVGEAREERLQGVEDDAPRAHRVDGEREADEEPVEVELPRLLDLGPLDADVLDDDPALGREAVEVEAERARVDRQLARRLLEREEHPRLAVLRRPPHEELHREERLAAAGRAAHERRAPAGQAPAGDLVESGDARRRLRQRVLRGRVGGCGFRHARTIRALARRFNAGNLPTDARALGGFVQGIAARRHGDAAARRTARIRAGEATGAPGIAVRRIRSTEAPRRAPRPTELARQGAPPSASQSARMSSWSAASTTRSLPGTRTRRAWSITRPAASTAPSSSTTRRAPP